MQKQHEDIVTAEAHLTGLMEELEDAMRRQFNAKFKDIKRVFQEVFVELFGGGEARLELTDVIRWIESFNSDFIIICDPEFKTISVLSPG